MVYGAYLLVPLASLVLYKTTFGLKVRAVGQNPQAADTLGVSVNFIRYCCVCAGGVLSGLAGATFTFGLFTHWDIKDKVLPVLGH